MPELPALPSSISSCTAEVDSPVMKCVLDTTIIEFRPPEHVSEYHGQFGFDWLRVTEHPTSELSYVDDPDGSNEGLILGGYKDGESELSGTEAREKWKGETDGTGEYDKFKIRRPQTTQRHLTYYVPYLNLYPEGVKASPIKYGNERSKTKKAPNPPTKATLRMIRDIKGQAPEKIVIEFDAKYFTINGESQPYQLDVRNHTPTNDDNTTSQEVITDTNNRITIKCIKEFDQDQRITVYAYPVGSSKKSEKEQQKEKRLAGQLIVCANSRPNRKVLKMVFVRVQTNTLGVGRDVIGAFQADEIINLYNTFYQGLVYPAITTEHDNKHIILDLTQHSKFIRSGITVGSGTNSVTGTGEYVELNGKIRTGWYKDSNDNYVEVRDFFSTVKAAFFSQYPAFGTGYFMIFCFDNHHISGSLGEVEASMDPQNNLIFHKSVALYKGRDACTLNHEALHGLKLRHTHRDVVVNAQESKYVFAHAFTDPDRATNNVMTYQSDAYTTWRWQWKILKGNI